MVDVSLLLSTEDVIVARVTAMASRYMTKRMNESHKSPQITKVLLITFSK
jgi:hypothetical protein